MKKRKEDNVKKKDRESWTDKEKKSWLNKDKRPMQQSSEDLWRQTESWSRSRGRGCATARPTVHGYVITVTINSGQCPEVRPLDDNFESVTNAVLEVDF